MAKLFLSYSRKDDARARRFTDWLEHDGHDVWRDEDDIGGGASFSSEIEKALKDCDAVLVLWSAESVQSAWVRDEASYGRDRAKLIPFSLDGTEPPLGFRQYQSIDLSKWKGRGDPSAAERIRSAIARLAEGPGPNLAGSDRKHGRSLPAIPRGLFATGIFVLVGLAFLSLFLWRNWAGEQGITIVVSASPTSPDRSTAADYANVIAADMAAFLPTRFEGAKVIAPGNADNRVRGYHIDVAARGQAADASLTLSDRDGRSILWSKSWSVRDISGIDLGEEVSRFASRAALCLTDAVGGRKRLTQPALGVFVSGCVGIIDSTWSPTQTSATFERVVALAPDFPPGWGYLAISRSFVAQEENLSGPAYAAAVRKAREAIATARRLNPRSGMAYLAESMLIQDDRVGSLALLDRGVAVEPTNALVQSGRADALGAVGRMAEAVQAASSSSAASDLSCASADSARSNAVTRNMGRNSASRRARLISRPPSLRSMRRPSSPCRICSANNGLGRPDGPRAIHSQSVASPGGVGGAGGAGAPGSGGGSIRSQWCAAAREAATLWAYWGSDRTSHCSSSAGPATR